MDKKIVVIVILTLIIIGLVWFIFSGKSKTDAIIATLQKQRVEFARSSAVIERELDKSKEYSKELEQLIDYITIGSEETEKYLGEYGLVSDDFAEFLRQADITDRDYEVYYNRHGSYHYN